MTDETSAARFSSDTGFLPEHRRRYIGSGGVAGHIIDLRFGGGRRYSPHLLLRYRGRRSGRVYVNPLYYGCIGGELVVIASKGGADHNPYWFENLIAHPEAEVQVATQAFRARWRLAEGEERDDLWRFMVRNNPMFAQYQSETERVIPVVVLTPGEEIERFVEPDQGAAGAAGSSPPSAR